MPGSMTDGDPVAALAARSRPEYRYFTIPANGTSEWNPELHGIEIPEADLPEISGDTAEVAWRPGQYEFNFGASGNSFILQVPEAPRTPHPSQDVLRGFHEFLKVAYDESA